MNLYEIIFKVGRNHRRWCRFANSEEQAQAEIIPVIENDYYGKKYSIVSIILTSVEAEENR